MYLCYITTQVFLYYKRPSTVDPPDAPMADRMVTNIRLAEPMTPAPDYRFYATFTWNPPVYPYKNITECVFILYKQPGNQYINLGNENPVSFFICLFVDNFKLRKISGLPFFFCLNSLSGCSRKRAHLFQPTRCTTWSLAFSRALG